MQTTQKMSFAGDHFFVGVDSHLKKPEGHHPT